jgi:TPP-dependent pyruvate/acetoin dehydrogenase alpha subunit
MVEKEREATMTFELLRDERTSLFERMLLMRRFEEMVIHAAAAHSYIGRNHLYIGHEATGAAAMAALREGDLAHTNHRNHGHLIARGANPGKALAEIMGQEGGLNHGRGGTWHMCDKASGFLSTSAMVGGSIGLAIGAAVALQRSDRGSISVAFFGDGALDEGISYEALNYASVFSLPVLFLCENNSKTGQRPSSMLAADSLTDIPRALRIDAMIVDGADADSVYATVSSAVGRVRKEKRPIFVESKLERWPGSHQIKPEFTTGETDISMAWDASRIVGEHADWIGRHDPILRYLRTLMAAGLLSADDARAIDKRVHDQMHVARAYAEQSPFPAGEGAASGVFA